MILSLIETERNSPRPSQVGGRTGHQPSGVVEPPICREHQGFTSVETATASGLQFCTMIEKASNHAMQCKKLHIASCKIKKVQIALYARFSLDQFNSTTG